MRFMQLIIHFSDVYIFCVFTSHNSLGPLLQSRDCNGCTVKELVKLFSLRIGHVISVKDCACEKKMLKKGAKY